MASKVAEKLIYCKKCKKSTRHLKNTKEMSWLMHFVLAVFTMGGWIIVWAAIVVWHILTKPVGGGWICEACGEKS
jgi:hypothetical protein